MGLSIRAKIFGGMITVTLLFISILLYLESGLGRIVDQEVAYSLRSGKRAYERFTELRDHLLINQARSIAQAPYLRAVMDIPDVDHETVYYSAQALYEITDISFMLLMNAEGRLLADLREPSLFGHNLRSLPGVVAGLDEGGVLLNTVSGTNVSPDAIYFSLAKLENPRSVPCDSNVSPIRCNR